MAKTASSSTPAAKKPAAAKVPTREEIALRAYHIYLRRKGAPGDERADWLHAEQELLSEKVKKPRARRKSNVTSIAA